jgi:16S rRNA (guanine527-N7)-methyltransferase
MMHLKKAGGGESNSLDLPVMRNLEPYGVLVTAAVSEAIQEYIRLLMHWNRRIALTSLTDAEEILRFHFGESLFAWHAVPIENGRLADVGTGAGFPGLALKLFRPGLHVTLLESNAKKCAFLREVVRTLSLTEVEVVRQRFEDCAVPGPKFDFIASRALGGLDPLLSWSLSVLGDYGRVVLWVGLQDARRISRVEGWTWREPIAIPGTKKRMLLIGERSLSL